MKKALLTSLLALMITSCANDSQPDRWRFSDPLEVRAFRMNWEDKVSFDRILNPDGSLNATRIPEAGIILTGKQVAKLKAAVTGTHPKRPVVDCFWPHHAFVFYNGSEEIVGQINICFLCSNHSHSGEPSGLAGSWDFDELAELVTNIGLPIQNSNWK
ncbi:MAG: hypothetical protein CMO61_04150 [Verrucomicrobiales bacterium]|nr:hypothetical protein [Verrucomicrobiales bacterium]|tara:strand:- start:5127 stop:5600 length:474 start_codon:yes stop_codon:yes gene_type:complete